MAKRAGVPLGAGRPFTNCSASWRCLLSSMRSLMSLPATSMARSTAMPRTSAMALVFWSSISRRAWALNSSASLRLLAISSSRYFSTSCWFLRIISAASRRASAMAVFWSASSFSASARSRLALSMALEICFSRSSTSERMGPHAFQRSTTSTRTKVMRVQKMRPGRTSRKLAARTEGSHGGFIGSAVKER